MNSHDIATRRINYELHVIFFDIPNRYVYTIWFADLQRL